MASGEFAILKQFGREWHVHVWLNPQSANQVTRDDILGRLNVYLNGRVPGAFRVNRGWQAYDTFVRLQGIQRGTYAQIAAFAVGQSDGGVSLARQVFRWLTTSSLQLNQLEDHMAILVVIVSFAEMARGYFDDVEEGFQDWIRSICNAHNTATARNLWLTHTVHFPPSLTYAQDAARDFVPEPGSDTYSDSDPDAVVSDNEMKDMESDTKKYFPNLPKGKRRR